MIDRSKRKKEETKVIQQTYLVDPNGRVGALEQAQFGHDALQWQWQW
jgi:hypothetical protein